MCCTPHGRLLQLVALLKCNVLDSVDNDQIEFNTAISVSGTGQSLVKTIKSKANNGIRIISRSATHYQPDQRATHYHCFIYLSPQ